MKRGIGDSPIILFFFIKNYCKSQIIYDIAGNVYEWTIEAYNVDTRISRGGYYNYSAESFPASFRDAAYPEQTYNTVGFRPALYLI